MRRVFALLALLVAVSAGATAVGGSATDGGGFEVWTIDQSDTTPDGGGTLYVYDGQKLSGQAAAKARPEVVDLGAAARSLCLAETGTSPRRPHMLLFSPTESHAVIAFVATGHVLFLDAATRAPLRCIDVGVQAHAAFPAPDGSYVVVANQNGKLLQRISTDYASNSFVLEPAATIDLATCVTPSGAPCQGPQRPDNAPICPVVDSSSSFTFVTLRGGGMFVVDSRATPMRIVAEYDRDTIHGNGCGGIETAGKMYVNSGGGTLPNLFESALYAFRLAAFSTTPSAPNTPAPTVVFEEDAGDSHGPALARRYLWVADRERNMVVVVDPAADAVVGSIALAGALSSDPSPDLLDTAPSGNRVFVSLRGPNPLTGDPHVSTGSTPGVGIIRVDRSGRSGVLQAIVPISHVVGGVERADPHALRVRQK